MRIRKNLSLLLLSAFITVNATHAQTTTPRDWHLMDLQKDSVYGISLQKAYDLLKGRTSQKVIVAVIDSGADTLSEDLKNVLWKNPGEIPGDGIDNDRNGYVDDVYGWNFLGDKNNLNNNVGKDSYEADRVYFRYKDMFETNTSGKVRRSQRKAYADWLKAKELLAKSSPEVKEIQSIRRMQSLLPDLQNEATAVGKNFTAEDLKSFEATTDKQKVMKLTYQNLFAYVPAGTKSNQLNSELEKVIDQKRRAIQLPVTPPVNYRGNVVKDDYSNIKDRFYGNMNVAAPDVTHGTHVSGIIGAQRNNNLGIQGVTDNVALMQLRAVPDGDEHDKDIALSIRYAVDNGAQIINMSFGKQVSPDLKWVSDALAYAEKKGVLVVHAAGNDARSIENAPNPPTKYYGRDDRKAFKNVITVGASNASKNNLVANFSNFGKASVDVFAPGVRVYATMPGVSNYAALSGTSMASPVVAGVAALLKSYFPSMTAVQIKDVIEKSVVKIDFPVTNPATKEKTTLSELSKTGGVVNAYNAVQLALQQYGR